MDASDELLRRAEASALLCPDGVVRFLNDPMAKALGKPVDRIVGRRMWDLVPASQRSAVHRLVEHAKDQRLAMRVLELPKPGNVSVVTLVEARLTAAAGGEPLVWLHSLNVHHDLGSLLIPYGMSAKAAGLGLCAYLPEVGQIEWMGGADAVGALIPDGSVSLPWVVRHVHPGDWGALRRLLDSNTHPWTPLRFRSASGDWHDLACQTRRIQLGFDGPEQVFGTIRDDTRQEALRQEMLAAVGAERRRADGIREFASALVTAATEQDLQRVVLTRLAATFNGAGAALALVDDRHIKLCTDAGLPAWRSAAPSQYVSLDDRLPLARALRTGTPVFIPDQDEYLRLSSPGDPALHWPGPDCAVSITPLGPGGERPLGAWLVAYGKEHHPTPDERAFMVTLAELAGQALERIRSQKARVDLASAVQRTMLPKLPERLPGLEVAARYRPCSAGLDVGGDWYDVFAVADGTVTLEIGDAQGHDADAAACMGRICGSMRAIASHESAPGTVLARTNELLVEMGASRFASCTILHIDPRDGQVTGASAGHVPLLRAHDDGSFDIHPLPVGPVLGIMPDADYPQEIFILDEDTALVLVTDGVVEAPDLTLDDGLKRTGTLAAQALREGLSCDETAGRILDDAIAMHRLDDLAVLVVRRA
ncbi:MULTISPECIES: SpoIIE family protein phosphatase [unclassified Streptomyces]|uniref:SpoIIE family protein phosphatase n=1 Tax=unclassified Streptomyces TaxID=2593676 RepID=UPI003829E026